VSVRPEAEGATAAPRLASNPIHVTCRQCHRPLGYVKVLGHLVPREMKVQLSQSLKSMSDEELDAAIEHLRGMLATRAGDGAKVIEGNPEAVALPTPAELERCQMRRWT
jgi:hypothetical protein